MRNPFLRLFFGIFVIEFFILMVFSQYFGFFNTILSALITSVIGYIIIRQQGIALLKKAATKAQDYSNFPLQLFQDLNVVFAGFFLLLPGFATDVLGVLTILPWTSRAIKIAFSKLTQRSQARSQSTGLNQFENVGPIIDGEYKTLTPDNKDYNEKKSDNY